MSITDIYNSMVQEHQSAASLNKEADDRKICENASPLNLLSGSADQLFKEAAGLVPASFWNTGKPESPYARINTVGKCLGYSVWYKTKSVSGGIRLSALYDEVASEFNRFTPNNPSAWEDRMRSCLRKKVVKQAKLLKPILVGQQEYVVLHHNAINSDEQNFLNSLLILFSDGIAFDVFGDHREQLASGKDLSELIARYIFSLKETDKAHNFDLGLFVNLGNLASCYRFDRF